MAEEGYVGFPLCVPAVIYLDTNAERDECSNEITCIFLALFPFVFPRSMVFPLHTPTVVHKDICVCV